MSGKYGSCTVSNENGEEQEVNSEWVRYGVMEVTTDDEIIEMEVE